MISPTHVRRPSFAYAFSLCLLVFITGLTGCAAFSNSDSQNHKDPTAVLEDKWGIRLKGVRLAAVGHLLDFRYQVTDPAKAEDLMSRGSQAFVIDEATGMKLPVPISKVGQLRGTGNKPQAGRTYAVLFANNRKVVKKGSAVTVVIAGFRVEHLIVE